MKDGDQVDSLFDQDENQTNYLQYYQYDEEEEGCLAKLFGWTYPKPS